MTQLADVKDRLQEINLLMTGYGDLSGDLTLGPMTVDLQQISSRLNLLTAEDESQISAIALEVEKLLRVYELSMIEFMRQIMADAIIKQAKKEATASKTLGATVKKLLHKDEAIPNDKPNTSVLMDTMLKYLDETEKSFVVNEQFYIKIDDMNGMIRSFAKLLGIAVPVPESKPAISEMAQVDEHKSIENDALTQKEPPRLKHRKHRIVTLMTTDLSTERMGAKEDRAAKISEKDELAAKIAEKEELLKKWQEIKLKISSIEQASTDPSIVYQTEILEKASLNLSEITALLNQLRFEQEIVQWHEKKLFEPAMFATMDTETKAKIIQWVDQLPTEKGAVSWKHISTWGQLLSSSKNPTEEQLTSQRLKVLNRKAMELQSKDKANPISVEILALESRYLQALSKENPCMTKSMMLIEGRLDELEQIQSSVSDYLATDRSSVSDQGSARNLPRLIQHITQLRAEIDSMMEEVDDFSRKVPSEDNDPLIASHIAKHKALSLSIEKQLHERDERVIPFIQSQAFMIFPLEYDRLSAQLEPNQQCLEQLTPLKKQMDENARELQTLLGKREALIRLTEDEIKKDIQIAKDDLEKIKHIRVYQTIRQDEIDQMMDALESIRARVDFQSTNGLPMSVDDINQKKLELLIAISDTMSSIKIKLQNINHDLKARIRLALIEVSSFLMRVGATIFNREERMDQIVRKNNELMMLQSRLESGIGVLIDGQYAQLLRIEAQIASESAVLERIKNNRSKSDLATVMSKMISTIDAAIQDVHDKDPMKVILESMRRELELKEHNYFDLQINERTLINDSLVIVAQSLSEENIHQLSEPQLNTFMRWIRHLVEPLMQYINKRRNVAYWPHLFASTTEKEVATTAQNLHQTLNEHLKRLDNPQFDSREELLLEEAEIVEQTDDDSTSGLVNFVHS